MNPNGRTPQAPDLRALLEARRAALLPCREATLASLNAIEGGLAEIALLLQQVDEAEACAALVGGGEDIHPFACPRCGHLQPRPLGGAFDCVNPDCGYCRSIEDMASSAIQEV